jgi:acetolactate synthase I/II/III large subunit
MSSLVGRQDVTTSNPGRDRSNMKEAQVVTSVMPVRESEATTTVSDALVDALKRRGCRRSFGILGGATVPFFSALVRQGLAPIHTRHESGAVFAAMEHELAGGGPGLVFTTSGPGLTNALTGIAAARWEGARLVVISASTGPDRRGRWAFQETDEQVMPHIGLFSRSGWFDYAISMQSAEELPVVANRLAEGLSRPRGFVAHVALPLGVQSTPSRRLHELSTRSQTSVPAPSPETMSACIERLTAGPVCIWVGFGARHAAAELERLVDALGAVVMCSPRAKGIFPESDPRFIGVTGFGGHERVFDRLTSVRPATTLVLGSRLGEFTSFWDPRLLGDGSVIHVDLDPTIFGAAYPEAETLGVHAEIGTFLEALLRRLPRRAPRSVDRPTVLEPVSTPPAAPGGGVRPSALMRSLQRVIERTDVPILSEAGNAFLWTTHALRFDRPGRYRTSMGFGSMGHAAAGVVGLALARAAPALAVVGDGSLLMTNEINTAVSLRAPAIWVVLNDGRYGLVADGMQGLGHAPFGLDFELVDFEALAVALGAEGITIRDEDHLDGALDRAISSGKPWVLDVRVDRLELAPFGARKHNRANQAQRVV